MSQKEVKPIGQCTYCNKTIMENEYREYFDGYDMHEMFCSSACSSAERKKNPIDHQAWKS